MSAHVSIISTYGVSEFEHCVVLGNPLSTKIFGEATNSIMELQVLASINPNGLPGRFAVLKCVSLLCSGQEITSQTNLNMTRDHEPIFIRDLSDEIKYKIVEVVEKLPIYVQGYCDLIHVNSNITSNVTPNVTQCNFQ